MSKPKELSSSDPDVEELCRRAKMGAIELQARALQDERTCELLTQLQQQLVLSDEDRRSLAAFAAVIEDQRGEAQADLERVAVERDVARKELTETKAQLEHVEAERDEARKELAATKAELEDVRAEVPDEIVVNMHPVGEGILCVVESDKEVVDE